MRNISKILAVLFFISGLSSCVSKPIPIPGDRKYVINNIYAEYLNIADIYTSLEKYDKAATYYKMAMQSPDLYWGAYYKLGKSYALQSDWKNALPVFKKLLKRDPDNCTIKSSLAYIYSLTGKLKIAKEYYFDIIHKEPENHEFLENYIAVLFLANDIDLAEVYFANLKEKFPDSKKIEKFQEELDKIKSSEIKTPELENDTLEDDVESKADAETAAISKN